MNELVAMRQMALERAKGELRSALHTFFGDRESFDQFDRVVTELIERIEGELQ